MMENTILHTIILDAPSVQLHERVTVIAIAAVLHFAVFSAWMMQPPRTSMPQYQMEVTMTVAPAAQPAPTPQPSKPKAAPKYLPVAPMAQAYEMPITLTSTPEPVLAAVPVIKAVEAEALVIEPVYKASYLNNSLPLYPLVARRMGFQGKVVLNVEVLAVGVSGQVYVHQSSGHDILDKAALQTVKSWRFIPARQAGREISMWFKVPIKFSLRDDKI